MFKIWELTLLGKRLILILLCPAYLEKYSIKDYEYRYYYHCNSYFIGFVSVHNKINYSFLYVLL